MRVVRFAALRMRMRGRRAREATHANASPSPLEFHPLIHRLTLTQLTRLPPRQHTHTHSIRGALEQVSIRVNVDVRRDPLKGDDALELRIKLHEYVSEEYPFKDD